MDRAQLARECVEIEKEGCSVRDFLASRGCLSPWGTWYRLQKEELGRKEWQITEGKGAKEMRKLTLENKKRAVEIALEGGNPQEYLKSLEVANPSASWIYIKKCLKARDPAKYDQLISVMQGAEEKQETAEPEPEKKPEEVVFEGKVYEKAWEPELEEGKPSPTCCQPARPSGVTLDVDGLDPEPKNDIPDGFSILSVGTPVGIFSRDKENIRFESAEGSLYVTGTAEWWQKLAEMMPKVLQVLE